jgi:hypothetical protein
MTAHSFVDEGDASALVIDQECPQQWKLSTRYELDRRAPVLTITWTLEYTAAGSTTLDGVEWTLPSLRLAQPPVPAWADIGASPVRVYSLQDKGLAVFWRSAEGDYAVVERADDRVRFALHMGGRVEPGTRMSGGGLRMAIVPDTGAGAVQALKTFMAARSVSAMGGAPAWARPAHIFETFIGTWPMDGDGRSYSAYPTVEDLVRDVPRISAMGFTIIYLMPRHPYPSYSTASFTDLGLQYGDGAGSTAQVLKLIDTAHRAGIRLILDVILHGGLDASAVAEQKKRQAHFGLADRPVTTNDLTIMEHDVFLQWIVYERAHEEGWRRAVPEVHPFWATHPEWFSKRKDGSCQYTYTRAFDLRSPAFQEFFASELLRCVQEFGVDGFRFDAPYWTWRQFNWGQDSYRASWTANGCIEILARAHHRIAEVNRDVCFYVESMDPNITRTANLQYTYDTYWGVIEALGRGTINPALARQRLAYIAATRVDGIVDVNTVDSHDTCWWFKVGNKWARERYSPEMARLLFALVSFLDAGVQMYSGGEVGMEEWVTRLLGLRRDVPVLRDGVCLPDSITCDSESTIPLWRSVGSEWIVPIIHFGARQGAVHLDLPETAARAGALALHVMTPNESGAITARDGRRVTLSLEAGCVAILCTSDFLRRHPQLA